MGFIFKRLLVIFYGLFFATSSFAGPNGVVYKQNKVGQRLEIGAWSDGARYDKYAVTDPSNRWRYYWFAQGGSANSGENNAPHSTSHDKWCRVRELYGDSVHNPQCNGKFMYKSFLITGLNGKHYEIWYRPGSISYYKLREQETGIWYAHDGSSNDGKKHTSKEDWCRIILFHGNGIIRSPKACNDVMKRMVAAGKGKASGSVSGSETTAMIEMMEGLNSINDMVTDPKGYIIGKATGHVVTSFMDNHNLRGTNAAGKVAEIAGESAANAVIVAALTAGGPASALAGMAVSVTISGAKALANASKDTTLSMYDGFQNHPRFDLDLNGISTSWRPPNAPRLRNAWGLCLDAARTTASQNGGTVGIYACHHKPNQMWTHFWNGRITNGRGLCLDAPEETARQNGGKVHLWTCADNNRNQKWSRKGPLLVNGHGFCLDMYKGKVQVWTCDSNNNNQKWSANF